MAYDKTKMPFVLDDPDLDGTDWSNPAWWRGSDLATEIVTGMVNSWLDDEQGIFTRSGSYAYPPLTKLRERIRTLMDSNQSLRDRMYEAETEQTMIMLNLANQIHQMGDQADNRRKAWKNLVDRNEEQRIEIRELKERLKQFQEFALNMIAEPDTIIVMSDIHAGGLSDQDKSAE